MKNTVILFLFCFFATALNAQWSNTTNYFADSLHMPVAAVTGTQRYPIILKSYPDGGYFVFWEDLRTSSNQTDIYAQKYDKNGNALWAVNGVPVATGANNQHFYTATNADYRNYSYAATDSANGFYLGYIDDSISTYNWQRICVQHIRSNGTKVFKGAGYIVAQTPAGSNFNYGAQQLIADGNKGFYIGFIKYNSDQDVYLFCYRDEGGTLKYYGGGQMNINAYESLKDACGNYDIAYRNAFVSDYMIYPDLQKGCNITMTLTQNAGGNDRYFTGFNRLVRVKKDCKVTAKKAPHTVYNYKKDSVLVFYRVIYHTYNYQCGDAVGTGYILDGNGYLAISNLTYNSQYAKGVAVATTGNINVNILPFNERNYIESTSTVTNWFTHTVFRVDEKTDSIPYQFTVFPYQPESYRDGPPPGQNKINYENDTLLYNSSVYPYDYSLAGGGSKIYTTARMMNAASGYDILLQQLQVKKITADSFAVQFATGATHHAGIKIGSNVSTGFTGTEIILENPQITTDAAGNALFYVGEYGRAIRVSPVINATQLAWGAMGRRIGSGAYTFGYYYPSYPYITLGTSGTGAVSWQDSKNIPANSYENINIRHLDSLTKAGYQPPYKKVKPLTATGGQAMPAVLLGSSKQYSLIEILNYDYNNGTYNDASPITDILDNANLGAVSVNVYENNSAIRTYNSKPYLSRNYTIQPAAAVLAGTSISLRLFFTTQQFTALKAAYPAITNPASLAVIKQPFTSANAPAAYTPVTGEVKAAVQSWKAVSGGYYIEIAVTKFAGYTNYFIFPKAATPFAALQLSGAWSNNTAALSWVNANTEDNSGTETIERKYTADDEFTAVQQRPVLGINAALVNAWNDAAASSSKGSIQYRIKHTGLDGDIAYSNIVTLVPGMQKLFIEKMYPTVVSNGRLYLQTGNEAAKQMLVEVFSADGKPVYKQQLPYQSQWLQLNLKAGGIYKVRISAGALSYNGSVVWESGK